MKNINQKVFIDSNFKGWILEGIVKESAVKIERKIEIQFLNFSLRNIETLLRYLFKYRIKVHLGDLVVNQGTLFKLVDLRMIGIQDLELIDCFFTHDSIKNLREKRRAVVLQKVRKIKVMNIRDAKMLINLGIAPDKILVVYGAIDREKFYPLDEYNPSNSFVYVTGDAKERKNPQKILDMVDYNPDLNFIINGRFWNRYIMNIGYKLPNNLNIIEDLSLNPVLMRNASAFVNLSRNEGGPYPVLESLASGTPVLATEVGWNTELISRKNGRLVHQEENQKQIRNLLIETLDLKQNVYHQDLLEGRFTWSDLAIKLYN